MFRPLRLLVGAALLSGAGYAGSVLSAGAGAAPLGGCDNAVSSVFIPSGSTAEPGSGTIVVFTQDVFGDTVEWTQGWPTGARGSANLNALWDTSSDSSGNHYKAPLCG